MTTNCQEIFFSPNKKKLWFSSLTKVEWLNKIGTKWLEEEDSMVC